jgi:Fe-S oxidoreductase
VILWADTFNNYFHPEVAAAAVEVIESAGWRVLVPRQPLCCGRPLYDFGMLDEAETMLAGIIDTLRPSIQAGTPVVGLEPSCIAVFRDELQDLFPTNQDAKRLSQQFFTLAELLESKTPGYHPPVLKRKAVVHGHCHHRSVMGMNHERKLLDAMKLDHNILNDTCCGMAGSFGFEEGKYEISMKVGELGTLPAVRDAAKDTLIVADGFSCRTQIEQGTDRQALHIAQVLKMALDDGPHGPRGRYPEKKYMRLDGAASESPLVMAASVAAGAVIGGYLLWRARR